jgi:predicted dehydrogenase
VPTLQQGDGYEHELRDFVDGIGAGRLSGIVTPESAARSVRVCLEERRSIVEGREVALD